MANDKILYVYFKKNNTIKKDYLDDMTKEYYKANREHFFCPNIECGALIEYCEGNKRPPYFRTKKSKVDGEIIFEQHIENCDYGIDHDSKRAPKSIYDPNIGFTVSDKHIKDVLKKANKSHNDPEYGKKNTKKSDTKRNSSNPIIKRTDEVAIRGRAVLAQQDEEESTIKKREPHLYQKYIDDISEKDYDSVRVVKGNVQEIIIDQNAVTIQLKSNTKESARIYFSEAFKTRYEQNFRDLVHYKSYFEKIRDADEELFIACAGDVRKDNYEVSVYVQAITHLTVNEIFHYDFLRKIGVIK